MAKVMAIQQGWTTPKGEPEEMKFEGSSARSVARRRCFRQTVDMFLSSVCETFRRLRESVNDGSSAAFVSGCLTATMLTLALTRTSFQFKMWEWYTTKPYLNEEGLGLRFIGHVDTPWPSWAIVSPVLLFPLLLAHPCHSTQLTYNYLFDQAATTSTLSTSSGRSSLRTFLSSLQSKVREFDSPASRASSNIEFIAQEFGYPREDIIAWLETVGYFGELEGMDEAMIRDTLDTLEKAGVVRKPEGGWTVKGEILAWLD